MQTCRRKVTALSVRDGRTDVSYQASSAEFVEDAIADGNNGDAASMEIPYELVDRSYRHFVARSLVQFRSIFGETWTNANSAILPQGVAVDRLTD